MSMLDERFNKLSDKQREMLEKLLRERRKKELLSAAEHIKSVETDNRQYPLTYGQEQIWFVNQLYPDSGIYNIAGISRIQGPLIPEYIVEAFKRLVQKHTVLRTCFKEDDGNIFAVVLENIDFEPQLLDYSLQSRTREEILAKIIDQETKKIFDLENAPLLRVSLICTAPNDWTLLVTVHHIISDGISTSIIFQEVISYYEKKQRNQKIDEKNLDIQFKDFAYWKRNKKQDIFPNKEAKEYWEKKLEEASFQLDFFEGDDSLEQMELTCIRKRIILNEKLVESLQDFSKKEKVTVFSILLSGLYLLLYKYSHQNDLMVGVLISGRDQVEVQNLIGCFIETLPVCTKINPEDTLINYVMETYNKFLQEVKYKDYYLNQKENNTCQFLFSYEEHPENKIDVAGFDISFEEVNTGFCQSNMDIELNKLGNIIEGWIDYRDGTFGEDYIEGFIKHYRVVLNTIVHSGDIKISSLEIIDEIEKTLVIENFNKNSDECLIDKTIFELFEEQVEKTPDNIAVVFKDKQITYKELDKKSSQLAAKLREAGVKPNDFVVLMVQRSIEMVIGIYGIIKSGGAYVPIDSAYPDDRIQYMISDCKPVAALIGDVNISFHSEIPVINVMDWQTYSSEVKSIKNVNTPNDLAYLIYTSGTTGKPKGVMLEHRNLNNLIYAYTKIYGLKSEDKVLQFASVSFDQSVWDIFNITLIGGTLCLVPYEMIGNPEELQQYMNEKKITVAALTPAVINELDPDNFPYLRLLESGGAASNIEVLKRWCENRVIFNTYGPTEATVNSASFEYKGEDFKSIPIGKPIPNTQMYILNGMDVCGIGMPGELCIAGKSIARGYLNQLQITNEKFIDNPFGAGKIYRSGDLAKWLPDGNLEYMGRIDEQVKIRGFRVELGEIETVIHKLDYVKDVAVIAREDETGDMAICAYIVSEQEISSGAIRDSVRKSVPEYMVPSYVMQIDKIPHTSNGKIDKKALPNKIAKSDRVYVAPRNKIEEKIADIFGQVLNVSTIGIQDNFFELGGHSLKLYKMSTLIYKELNVKIPINILFNNTTVEDIGKYIQTSGRTEYQTIKKIKNMPYYNASAAQKRMYILYLMDKESRAYNIPFAVKINGEIDYSRFSDAIQKVIKRQESLRTSFKMIDYELKQEIHNEVEFHLDCNESCESVEILMEKFFKTFHLENDTLFRIQLVKVGKDCHYLLGDFHHIIADGVSLDIFLKDFYQYYQGNELEPLEVQYKDFACWHEGFLKSEELLLQRDYWIQRLGDNLPLLNLEGDYKRPLVKSFSGDVIYFSFDKELTSNIRSMVQKTQSTMYIVLLSFYNILLWKYTNQEDIIVGSPVEGRNLVETENIIGLFINSLAMRNFPKAEKSVLEFVKEVKQNTIFALQNQDYPFDLLIEELNIKRYENRNPIFDTMFIMQNGDAELNFGDFTFELCKINYKSAKFDIKLECYEKEESLDFIIDYSTDLFSRGTVERFISNFEQLSRVACLNENKLLGEIELKDSEMESLAQDFSDDFDME